MTENNNLNKIKKLILGDKPALNLMSFIITILLIILFINFTAHITNSNRAIAAYLLETLESSAAIYVAQQRKPPNLFTDFVTSEGTVTPPYTLSLENIDASKKIINSKELTITFDPKERYEDLYKATYYLNGTDVTANYNFNNDG